MKKINYVFIHIKFKVYNVYARRFNVPVPHMMNPQIVFEHHIAELYCIFNEKQKTDHFIHTNENDKQTVR